MTQTTKVDLEKIDMDGLAVIRQCLLTLRACDVLHGRIANYFMSQEKTAKELDLLATEAEGLAKHIEQSLADGNAFLSLVEKHS